MADYLPLALKLLEPVLLALLGLLSAAAARWIQAHVANVRASTALLLLNDAVATAVGEVEQTVMDRTRAALADGKIDAAERADLLRVARDSALGAVKNNLGERGVAAVRLAFGHKNGALEAMIISRIEAEVAERKAERPMILQAEAVKLPEAGS